MKPGIPKGTRDFSPVQVEKRQYIFSVIKKVFKTYGYVPIETPVMENLSTLTGKYGEEGDKLLFKILNNGDFLRKANKEALENMDSNALISSISDRGLRYDLTVPFARYVVMHQNDISFPFKRYQIQQVWRADRPQKGRYREFYQCDADVVGSDSLMYEAELVKIYDEVFRKLGLNVTIKINNRKVLFGIAESQGIADKFMDMTISIDKLDKIGSEAVLKEMMDRGIGQAAASNILELISIENLDQLGEALAASPTGIKGIAELREFHKYLDQTEVANRLEFDVSLARGLNYYTGCILEVISNDVKMGSIGGGGRYDDLTGVFGMKGVSGVGISFGAARIYDVMEELKLFPAELAQNLKVLILALDKETHTFAYRCLAQLRQAGIPSDLYPTAAKLKKQMKYANDLHVPYTIVIGSDEMTSGMLSLKNMDSGHQEKYSIDQICSLLA
ncbi:MAG: histidine--tRNA ligase [Saprospiraceae bacterium]|nr:histidine--tRNA ligase [Saprospiraceae bacterium]NNK89107.1 histidine--tRNA ligase [Saprospiraceae bacterium]